MPPVPWSRSKRSKAWRSRSKASGSSKLPETKSMGYIGVQDEQNAIAELATFEFSKVRELGQIKAPHFVFYVEDQLREMLGDELVNAGGLVVHTSLDYALQASSEAIVKQEIEKVANMGISNLISAKFLMIELFSWLCRRYLECGLTIWIGYFLTSFSLPSHSKGSSQAGCPGQSA